MFPDVCLQACRVTVSIQIHDQFATQLLDAVQRGKLKMELGMSQAAPTSDEIYRELLKGHANKVVSKPEAMKTSPKAAAAGLERDTLLPCILLWPVMHTPVQGQQLQGLIAAEAPSIDAVLSQKCWDPFG